MRCCVPSTSRDHHSSRLATTLRVSLPQFHYQAEYQHSQKQHLLWSCLGEEGSCDVSGSISSSDGGGGSRSRSDGGGGSSFDDTGCSSSGSDGGGSIALALVRLAAAAVVVVMR
ncbi:hypothetical protein Pmani_015779 [Petrolisthes manimaculis]|uniref:Uncharacterized protein n=1 Tax=Petrolisthes manimaculis TaxID=1843537 RepID=A0AAE1PT03_9EUCA|nr:hypothetical protein Pmani_015779 [Petrolisthes manimaculis]